MQLMSTSARYGAVAIAIHWVTAIALFGLLVSGFQADALADGTARRTVLAIHAATGLSVLVLTVLRLLWWWLKDTRPAPVAGPKWQRAAAHAVHALFYGVIVVMGVSGIGMLVLSGAGPVLFLGAQGPLPAFADYAPRAPHGLGARLVIALALIHIGAALYHQFVLRDGILARMGLPMARGRERS